MPAANISIANPTSARKDDRRLRRIEPAEAADPDHDPGGELADDHRDERPPPRREQRAGQSRQDDHRENAEAHRLILLRSGRLHGRCHEGRASASPLRHTRPPEPGESSDGDVAEEGVEAEVVDALEGAGDQERRAEPELERAAGEQRRDRSRDVAGGVGVGGGGGSLAGVDDGDDVGLAGGDVHLREREAGEQERDRGREVGCEGDGGEEQVGGQVGEDHRAQEAEPAGEANGDLEGERLEEADREEDDRECLRGGAVLAGEEVGDERLRHEAATEAVEREQPA